MHEDCKALFEKISAYLDGELDGKTCEQISQHLEDCPECLNCFESLKKTVELCKNFPKEKISGEIHERLRATLRAYLNRNPA